MRPGIPMQIQNTTLAPLRSSVPLSALALLALAPQSGRIVKLNGPLPRPTVAALAQITLAPGGGQAVFRADLLEDEVVELFRVPTDGSGLALRLNARLPTNGDVGSFQLVPGRELVVYSAEQRTDEVRELYSVPLDRSHPPLRLNRTPAPGSHGVDEFQVSANGLRVAYLADLDSDHVRELFGAEIERFADDVKLSAPLTANGNVVDFALTADGGHAVYLADEEVDERFELFAVAPDLTRVKLNGPLIPSGDVAAASNGEAFLISPDGSRVVYRADYAFDEYFALFSVPIDASLPAVRLSPQLASGERVTHFRIDPHSNRVLFGITRDFDLGGELYSVPIDGSAPPLLLSSSVHTWTLQISPDGERAVFTAEPGGLFSVPMDGSSPAQRLDPPPYDGEVLTFRIRPDSAGLVFRSQRSSITALAAVPIDGSATPTPLSLTADETGSNYAILPDSSTVLFVGQRLADGPIELLRVPIDNSSPPAVLSGPLVEGGRVYSFQLSADGGEVLYRASQEIATVSEAFAVPSDGSALAVKVNPPLPAGPAVGDVSATFQLGLDDRRVVFVADQEEDGLFELFSAAIDARDPLRKLNDGRSIHSFAVSPDGALAVHFARGPLPYDLELFSAPVDGSTAPVRLAGWSTAGNPLLASSIRISPDSRYAVCQLVFQAMPSNYRGPLECVALNGAPGGGTLSGAGVSTYSITPDSLRVVYDEDNRLYSRLLDGSGPAVDLSGPLASGGNLSWILVTPDSARVLYTADAETLGLSELYGVPIDGGAAPYKLSGPAAGVGTSHLAISADSAWVVFAQETAAGARLFSCLSDGSGVRIELAQLGSSGAQAFPLVGAGDRVVFRDYLPGGGEQQVLSVPIDGSAAPLPLSGPCGDFALTPDGTWVVHTGAGLFSVPLDGSHAPLRLSRSSSYVSDFALSADSRVVAFRTERALFRTAIDGSLAATRVNTRLVDRGAVDSRYQLTADGATIVYRADQEEDETYELFAGHHFGYDLPAPGPNDAGSRAGP